MEIIKDIKAEFIENKINILLYFIGSVFLYMFDSGDISMLGFLFISIVGANYLYSIYNKYEKTILKKMLFYLVGLFSLAGANFIASKYINYATGLPTSDFPISQIVISSLIYIPIFTLLSISILFLSYMMIFILRMFLGNLGIEIFKMSFVKEIVLVFNLIGVLYLYSVTTVVTFKYPYKNKESILSLIEVLDYNMMNNYPDVPKDKPILIHNGIFYSFMEKGDDGNLTIKIKYLNKL
ncbi:hypothetical protein RYD26_03150 [Pasteurellaceae bacterium LIM206]|nr:hypothetical protein [Pasteurellaceae bacterium LIM206]